MTWQKDIVEIKANAEKLRIEMVNENRIEMENLRHKHIMEEIEAMKKAKVTAFVRQIQKDADKKKLKKELKEKAK